MKLRITNPEYYQNKTIERYESYYKQLERYNSDRAKAYINLSQELQTYISELFTRYSNREGVLSYSEGIRPLTRVEKASYFREIENIASNFTKESHINQANLLLMESNPSRMDSMLNLAKLKSLAVSEDDSKELLDFLTGIYLDNFYKSLYEFQKGIGVAKPVEKINLTDLQEQILSPWAELPMEEYIFNINERLNIENRKTVTKGLSDELSLVAILQLLNKNVDKAYRNQKLINESELTHNMNKSKEESTLNSGITDSYILIATLDTRTTQLCRDKDGKVYKYAEKVVGKNYPPFHFFCRSVISDYFSDDDLREYTRRARNPYTNQNYLIPANITYREWESSYLR